MLFIHRTQILVYQIKLIELFKAVHFCPLSKNNSFVYLCRSVVSFENYI